MHDITLIQVRAIREGFLSVVPEAALNLITWREIEIRICGNPEITIEELRKSGDGLPV